jgi:hypothetical protein
MKSAEDGQNHIARVDEKRQADRDKVDGGTPSTEGRHEGKTGAAEKTPSKTTGQRGQETVPEDITKKYIFSFFSLSLSTHVPIPI